MPASNDEGFVDYGYVLNAKKPADVINVEIHADSDSTTVVKDLVITECVKGNIMKIIAT